MAIPSFNAVGFCAHYSKQGDWAFDYAMRLAKQSGLQLNVFHFLNNPYDKEDNTSRKLNAEEAEKLALKKEKELRLYYDDRAGDFLNVGFRICYDDSWIELHRCLFIREFQALVLAYPHKGAFFAKKPIEEFAESFVSPVILVGPDKPNQLFINRQAELLSENIGIKEERSVINEVTS